MASHLFVLGRTPQLAFAELLSFIPGATRVTPFVAIGDVSVDPHVLINELGGTVKIGYIVGTLDSLSPERLVSFLVPATGSVTFGISSYAAVSAVQVGRLLRDMKQLLEAREVKARFVAPREGTELTSVVVAKQHVIELIVVKVDAGYMIAKTLAVQKFEAWNARDYGRPHADARSGMLPPKVARMVVNIAKGELETRNSKLETGNEEKKTPLLVDPFCGMGTVVAEALMTGWNTLGGDISPDVIMKAKKNISWLVERYPHAAPYLHTFFVSDAVHLSDKVPASSVDAIVTEPFMGKQREGRDKRVELSGEDIKKVIKGLEKLYIGCLKDWHAVLRPGGVVMMALPVYVLPRHEYTVKRVVDMCETLGYTIVVGPIEYSRPQAHVKRQFYVFKKYGTR